VKGIENPFLLERYVTVKFVEKRMKKNLKTRPAALLFAFW
jgi:hypothetical protein